MADGVAAAPELEVRSSAALCAWASCSEAGADALRERLRFLKASLRAAEEWDVGPVACALDRGRASAGSMPSSQQMVHGAGRPSVTIRGVGPWRSQ